MFYLKKYLLVNILIVFYLLCTTSCMYDINKFRVDEITLLSKQKYSKYFDYKYSKLLKEEWKELFLYLKRGHIQNSESSPGQFIYSYKFYKFLGRNQLRIYETASLKSYDDFVKIFGVDDTIETDDKIILIYGPSIIDDTCETCSHNKLFSYTFDRKTRLLLKE